MLLIGAHLPHAVIERLGVLDEPLFFRRIGHRIRLAAKIGNPLPQRVRLLAPICLFRLGLLCCLS